MRNLLSSLFFVLVFVALGAMAFAAAPRGEEVAQPAVAAAEVEAQQPDAPDAPTAINWTNISIPLSTASVSTADDVAAYIDDTNSSIQRVARWDEAAQSLEIRNVGAPLGVPNFNVEVGDWLLVGADANAPTSFAWVGDVPAQGSISYSFVANGWTAIMLPLDQDGVATADDLGAAIGSGTRVARWDAVAQSLEIRNVGAPLGVPNFDVNVGYPYLVYSTAATTWP